MSSPIKNKAKKGEPTQSKKRQLLKVFHQTISFLQIFTPDQIQFLQDKLHIFVFTRGQVLAKQHEYIDYVGIVAEGRAVSKSKSYPIGETIGHSQVLGFQNTHPESILGQADGVLLAMRIYDLNTLPKAYMTNKIVSYFAELHMKQLLKRQDLSKQISQFQTVDQRKVSKFLIPEWSNFLSELDLREKIKFMNYFPFYVGKQKDMLMNSCIKPSFLYVVNGQIIAKSKGQQKIIQGGHFYNSQGWILNQKINQNIYCLSTEAIFVIIDRQILLDNFKTSTYNGILRMILKDVGNIYKVNEQKKQKQGDKSEDIWSMFKKHPDREILPLPKKSNPNVNKSIKIPANKDKEQLPFLAFQTLFRQQLGNAQGGKVKTSTSVADSNYERLYSMKTQPKQKESFTQGETDKLRKQVQILTQKLKFAQQISKQSRLDLIENRSKLNMNEVFKQIRKLHQQQETIHKVKGTEGQTSEGILTFKQAFDKQIKENRIKQLVAKCAFRWLYLTRKHKSNKKM